MNGGFRLDVATTPRCSALQIGTIQRPPGPVGVSTTGSNGSVEGRGRLIEPTY
jgi:hypothetical protein